MINQQQLLQQLDDAESRFLARYDAWLKKAAGTIPLNEVERLKKQGGPNILSRMPAAIATDPDTLTRLLSDHAAEMIGAGRAHGHLLAREILQQYRGRKMGDLPGFDFEYSEDPRVIPEQAIAAMKQRSIVLAGDVDGALIQQVKQIMTRFLAGGTRPEAEQAVEDVLAASRNRASLITTTETTYSYNRGRLASFADDKVDYLRFSAVMDGRTSQICISRHGLIMRMDDPRVADNTPPLHGRCRSVLDPLYSAYQGSLITDRAINWNGAAALPKGWRTSEK